jgi:hypothetical protein
MWVVGTNQQMMEEMYDPKHLHSIKLRCLMGGLLTFVHFMFKVP